MSYDFTKFQPQPFQALAQALASKELGPGIKVFGDGPDGAREASFEGPVPIVTHGSSWAGYGVVQAKCRAVPRQDSSDADWLIQQLKDDLAKFLDLDRGLRRPEYYLAITNISLSGVQSPNIPGTTKPLKKGGKQKIEEFLNEHPLKLKGWLVWDAAELSALLDNAKDVREKYSFWTTPSDVLSAALAKLERPNLQGLIPIKLSRDLRNSRDIKRKEARQNSEESITLHDAFVDLPLERAPRGFLESEDEILAVADVDNDEVVVFERISNAMQARDKGLFCCALTERAAWKLDPVSLSSISEFDKKKGNKSPPLPNRIVVLGGPGQGKSTLSQFIAQFFRARALLNQPLTSMPPEVTRLAKDIITRATAENMFLTGPIRYPVRVELPSFADAIETEREKGKSLSVLAYIAQGFSAVIDIDVHADEMRKWLQLSPWLVIFDGLDEVPPSSNRAAVISAINDFTDEIYAATADVLILVTTRQQGYGDDLDPRYWEHWNLAALRSGDAMRYAGRQADSLLSDPDRKASILKVLDGASKDPATAPLMTSPLQVSMLLALAEVNDNIPHDRWTLFTRHYEVLRDREAAKPGARAKIVREYQALIDEIHHECGFILHQRAEGAGKTESFLTADEFEKIVSSRLVAERYSEQQIGSLTSQITNIATQRLVFLSARVEGRIAFDVRSLQEYMAAAFLMSGPESYYVPRLRTIAARSHWRHVFRIAASKIFGSTLRHLRAEIISICSGLDRRYSDEADALVSSGSRLALDLLGDNVAARQPGLLRQLVECSFGMLNLGPAHLDSRLVAYVVPETVDTYKRVLNTELSGANKATSAAALKVTERLSALNIQWATDLICDTYSTKRMEFMELWSRAKLNFPGPGLVDFFDEAITQSGYRHVRAASWRTSSREWGELDRPRNRLSKLVRSLAELSLLNFHPGQSARAGALQFLELRFARASDRRMDGIAVRLRSAAKRQFNLDQRIIDKPKLWAQLLATRHFLGNPSPTSLSEALEMLYECEDLQRFDLVRLPWPLAAILMEYGNSKEALKEAQKKAIAGEFGGPTDWSLAETRWTNSGILLDDLNAWASGHILHKDIATIGAPPLVGSMARSMSSPEDVETLAKAASNLKDSKYVYQLNDLLVEAASRIYSFSPGVFTDEFAKNILIANPDSLSPFAQDTLCRLLIRQAAQSENPEKYCDILDTYGCHAQYIVRGAELHENGLEVLMDLANKFPDKTGILYLLAMLAGESREDWLQKVRDKLGHISFKDHKDGTVRALFSLIMNQVSEQDVQAVVQFLASNQCRLSPSVINAVICQLQGVDRRVKVLAAFCAELNKTQPVRSDIVIAPLIRMLNGMRSGLCDPKVCKELDLPFGIEDLALDKMQPVTGA